MHVHSVNVQGCSLPDPSHHTKKLQGLGQVTEALVPQYPHLYNGWGYFLKVYPSVQWDREDQVSHDVKLQTKASAGYIPEVLVKHSERVELTVDTPGFESAKAVCVCLLGLQSSLWSAVDPSLQKSP